MGTNLFLILTFAYLPLMQSNASPTKLCGNEDCAIKLFTSTAKRNYDATHEGFISFKLNETIDVYAIKMSNRPDIIEGVNSEGKRGLLYLNFLHQLEYVFYLMKVVEENTEMYEVKQLYVPGETKLVKMRPANPYLWRDYDVKRKQQTEVDFFHDIPMLPDPEEKKKTGHHHHHHEHDHDHHDHEHDHDHKHEEVAAPIPEATTVKPAPVKTPEPLGLASIMKGELPTPTVTPPPKVENIVPEMKSTPPEVPASAAPLSNEIPMDPTIVDKLPTQEKAVQTEEKSVPSVEAPKPAEIPNLIPVNELPKPIDPLATDIPTPSPTPASEQDALPPLTTPTPVQLPPPPITATVASIEIPTIAPTDNVAAAKPVEQPIRLNIPNLIYDQIEKVLTTEAPPVTEAAMPPRVETPIKMEDSSPKIEDIQLTTTLPPKIEEIPTITIAPPKVEDNLPILEDKFEEEKLTGSVLKETIHEPQMDEYCYTDECLQNMSNTTSFVSTNIRPIFLTISKALKSVLPYPVSHFDDTGVFVFLCFVFSTVIYVINWLFQDGGRKDVLDRRALHDAITRIKEQQVQIEHLKKNTADPKDRQEMERLRMDNERLLQEHDRNFQVLKQKESDCMELIKEKNHLQSRLQQTLSEKTNLQNDFETVSLENSHLVKETELLRSRLKEADERRTNSEIEIEEFKRKINHLEVKVSETENSSTSLQIKLDHEIKMTAELQKKVEDLENENLEKMEVIAELQKQLELSQQKIANTSAKVESVGSGESNASNGWSDMDLGDLDVPETTVMETTPIADEHPAKKVATFGKKNKKEKEKEPSPEQQRKISIGGRAEVVDKITEVLKLKKNLSALEKERDDLKWKLGYERNEKENIERQLEESKKSLSDKKEELERINKLMECFQRQAENLNHKLEESSNKIEQIQQVSAHKIEQIQQESAHKIDKLEEDRERMYKLKDEIRLLTIEKENAIIKIKELERMINRADEDNKKAETRFFTEERRLRDHIRNMEAELNKVRLSASLQAGSGNSSDQDYSFTGLTTNGLTTNEVRSLWSDVDPETSFDDHLTGGQDIRRRSGRGLYEEPIVVQSNGRRSTQRREGQPSTQRRYRSRSAGRRQSGVTSPNNVQHASSRASPMNAYERNTEHRRSTNRLGREKFYYSSDGSNGLSPPPALPPQSGVIPSTVQLHRPTPRP